MQIVHILALRVDEDTVKKLKEDKRGDYKWVVHKTENDEDLVDIYMSFCRGPVMSFSVVLVDVTDSGLIELVARLIRHDDVKLPIIGIMREGKRNSELVGKFIENGGQTLLWEPISYRELTATILRALPSIVGTFPEEIHVANGFLKLYPDRQTASVADKNVPLTPPEYRVLEVLAKNPGMTFSRSRIVSNIYDGENDPSMKIVDANVCRVRKRLNEKFEGAGNIIETVPGVGYCLRSKFKCLESDSPQVPSIKKLSTNKEFKLFPDVSMLLCEDEGVILGDHQIKLMSTLSANRGSSLSRKQLAEIIYGRSGRKDLANVYHLIFKLNKRFEKYPSVRDMFVIHNNNLYALNEKFIEVSEEAPREAFDPSSIKVEVYTGAQLFCCERRNVRISELQCSLLKLHSEYKDCHLSKEQLAVSLHGSTSKSRWNVWGLVTRTNKVTSYCLRGEKVIEHVVGKGYRVPSNIELAFV